MKVEHPQAYRFIMEDEIYLLPEDKLLYTPSFAEEPTAIEATAITEPVTPEPVITVTAPITEKLPQPVAATPAQTVEETQKVPFNYLGHNKKNFLILVNYANEQHIAADHLKALESILSRKQLTIDDVAVLNVNSIAPVKLPALTAYFNPIKLVVMGKDALPEGIGNLPINKPVQGKKIHVLYSFSFDEMMSSNDNKKAFWEQMKTL